MRNLVQYAYINKFKKLAENPSYFNRWVISTYESEFIADYVDAMVEHRGYMPFHWSTRIKTIKALVHQLKEKGALIESL